MSSINRRSRLLLSAAAVSILTLGLTACAQGDAEPTNTSGVSEQGATVENEAAETNGNDAAGGGAAGQDAPAPAADGTLVWVGGENLTEKPWNVTCTDGIAGATAVEGEYGFDITILFEGTEAQMVSASRVETAKASDPSSIENYLAVMLQGGTSSGTVTEFEYVAGTSITIAGTGKSVTGGSEQPFRIHLNCN